MTEKTDNDSLMQDFFREGVEQADLPALFPLLQARGAISAFIALFRGGEDEVLIRLLVLREIGGRGEQPCWSPQELRAHFAYLDPVKLETVLARLRERELLLFEGETGLYQVSPQGRMALSAISTLLKFGAVEGDDLGYITSQLAAGAGVGQVDSSDLQHLLSRLNELQEEFNRAVLSGSEHRIRSAEKRLHSVWRWVEKGTELMRRIAAGEELDPATHRVAQRIGQVQSRLLRMASVFQRTLNQLESQKVHLGQSGLTTTDINRWLRTLSEERLCALAAGALSFSPAPGFLLADIALDVAEHELIDRVHDGGLESALPEARSAQVQDAFGEAEKLPLLKRLFEGLSRVSEPRPLHELLLAEDFETSSYRFSLAALLGDPESQALEGQVADLARLPLEMHLDAGTQPIGRFGVAAMSSGRILPKEQERV